jgi:type I restriction enzyme, S subunit
MTMAKRGTATAVPRLRFPEFRSAKAWTTIELRQLSEFVTERVGTTDCTPYTVSSGVGLVSQQEKLGRTIAGNSLKNYIVLQKNDFAYNKSATKAFPQGLIARYVGEDRAAVPNSIFTCFRTNDDLIDPTYLDNLFSTNLHGNWLRNRIAVGARAHGSLNVSYEDLMDLPVPLPAGSSSLVEQKKIADCLTSLDEVIAAHGRKVEALKAHKRGLMQQLFPREGETRPRLRFPEFRNAPGWSIHPFEHFVTRSFYGTSSSTSEMGQYPVLRMGNMLDGELNFSNLAYIDLDPESFQKTRLLPGDILLNRTNSPALVGKISMFNRDIECITASYIVTYRLDKGRINPAFCNLMLNTPHYQAKVNALARPSVSQANINPTTFRKELFVSVPQFAEQQRIADCLSSLDTQIAAESDQLAALKTHKQGLMQQLFPTPEAAGA